MSTFGQRLQYARKKKRANSGRACPKNGLDKVGYFTMGNWINHQHNQGFS
jgi:hypothetical protein